MDELLDQIAKLLVDNDIADHASRIDNENAIGFTTEAGEEYFITLDPA